MAQLSTKWSSSADQLGCVVSLNCGKKSLVTAINSLTHIKIRKWDAVEQTMYQ